MLTIIRLGVRLVISGKLILRLLPKTGRPICISIGMMRGYWFLLLDWKLLRLPEGPYYTTKYSTAWRLGVLIESSKVTHHFYPVWVACSHSLIPGTHLIAVTSAVYVLTLPHWILPLSRIGLASVLCRWLAGVFRESLHPYFIRSTFLRSYAFFSQLIMNLFLFSSYIIS